MAEQKDKIPRVISTLNQKGAGFFYSLFNGIEPGRQGYCTPKKCSTLDGKTGAACCKLSYECPLLSHDLKCRIYGFRFCFPNCPKFPRTRKDLEKVVNCTFSWPDQETNNNSQAQQSF